MEVSEKAASSVELWLLVYEMLGNWEGIAKVLLNFLVDLVEQ